MNSSAPEPADAIAFRKLRIAARNYVADEILNGYAATNGSERELMACALAFAQAVKDAKRASKTTRRSKR